MVNLTESLGQRLINLEANVAHIKCTVSMVTDNEDMADSPYGSHHDDQPPLPSPPPPTGNSPPAPFQPPPPSNSPPLTPSPPLRTPPSSLLRSSPLPDDAKKG